MTDDRAADVGRADVRPGAATTDAYGATPLRWGGAGAERLGLIGDVTPLSYACVFGTGGFRDGSSGERLVTTKRPGFELVVSAHKAVTVLGIADRADAMHRLLDAETSATMDWLDGWFQERGGRRGKAHVRTATGGLVYARTRHGTSRAGDPLLRDLVLVANVVEMLDDKGGFKGLDSAALRDAIEAATMVGRLHSAARAVEMGFTIEPDDGPSGNLRHWSIVGIPVEVCDLFSKRSGEITAHLAESGQPDTCRARRVAAHLTRSGRRCTDGVDDLPTWRAELASNGWSATRLGAALGAATQQHPALPGPLSRQQMDELAGHVLHRDGGLNAHRRAFTRTRAVTAVAPLLYGHDPAELERLVDHILTGALVVPLRPCGASREPAYATAETLRTAPQTFRLCHA